MESETLKLFSFSPSLTLSSPTWKFTVRRWPSENQKEGSDQTPNWLASWFGLLSFHNCEKDVCFLSYPIYSIYHSCLKELRQWTFTSHKHVKKNLHNVLQTVNYKKLKHYQKLLLKSRDFLFDAFTKKETLTRFINIRDWNVI